LGGQRFQKEKKKGIKVDSLSDNEIAGYASLQFSGSRTLEFPVLANSTQVISDKGLTRLFFERQVQYITNEKKSGNHKAKRKTEENLASLSSRTTGRHATISALSSCTTSRR
jgi:hypothetical protein